MKPIKLCHLLMLWVGFMIVLSASNLAASTSTTICFQPQANVSTTCGGLSTGKYAYAGTFDAGYWTNTFDMNYTSYISASNAGSEIKINYTVPRGTGTVLNTTSANFRIYFTPIFYKDININSTCNITYWNNISLKWTSDHYTGTRVYCSLNAVDYTLIYTDAINNDLYETEMYWNITYNIGIDNCSNSFGISTNATTLNVSILDANNISTSAAFKSTTVYADTYYSFNSNSLSNISYCIYPSGQSIPTYTQFLYNDSVNQYSYFLFTNFSNVTQKLYLYTQIGTSQVLFTVTDLDDNKLYLYTIHILKYNVGTGTYTTTEILQTDSNGHAIGNIVLNNAYYNLLIYDANNNLVKTYSAIIFPTTSFSIVVGAADAYFTQLGESMGLLYTMTFTNETNNFVFTWSDPTGKMHYACLKVTNTTYLGTSTMSDTCALSTSGTIVYNIVPQNETTYVGQPYLKYDNVFSLNPVSWSLPMSNLLFKVDLMGGLFITAMLVMVGILLGLPNPIIGVVYFCLAIIVTWKLGLFSVSLGMVSSVVILGIIMMYIGNRQQ